MALYAPRPACACRRQSMQPSWAVSQGETRPGAPDQVFEHFLAGGTLEERYPAVHPPGVLAKGCTPWCLIRCSSTSWRARRWRSATRRSRPSPTAGLTCSTPRRATCPPAPLLASSQLPCRIPASLTGAPMHCYCGARSWVELRCAHGNWGPVIDSIGRGLKGGILFLNDPATIPSRRWLCTCETGCVGKCRGWT